MQKVDSAPQLDTALPQQKAVRTGKLSDEIRMVRTLLRQVETMTRDAHSVGELLEILESVSRASASLANLLKAEKALEENQSAADYVKAALNEIREEMERKRIDSVLTSGLG